VSERQDLTTAQVCSSRKPNTKSAEAGEYPNAPSLSGCTSGASPDEVNVRTSGATQLELNGSVLGVKLVWTSPRHRRQRVAHRLLDSVRKSALFGSVVQVQRVAFSQPTEDGFAFAQAYCRSKLILAYA
jgi:hypothetical protein